MSKNLLFICTQFLWVALTSLFINEASATTFIRADIDTLVDRHQQIVKGKVIEKHSYWNEDGTMIMTDVTLQVEETLKGTSNGSDLVITILGGSVGETSTLIIGGAELEQDKSYLLFVNRQKLGLNKVINTLTEHSQGAFDEIKETGKPLRYRSQAKKEHLVPDKTGISVVAGGEKGLEIDDLRNHINKRNAMEVK